MRISDLLLVFVLLLVPAFIQAEELNAPVEQQIIDNSQENFEENFDAELHPIDREVNRLMALDESTNGQIQALARGYELWDAELNQSYKDLMQAYGSNDQLKSTLKEAQLAWIKYRDASFKHFEAVCESKEGSMYRMFLASDRMNFVKARVLELKAMYGSFTETS